jgi:hypothetical protein
MARHANRRECGPRAVRRNGRAWRNRRVRGLDRPFQSGRTGVRRGAEYRAGGRQHAASRGQAHFRRFRSTSARSGPHAGLPALRRRNGPAGREAGCPQGSGLLRLRLLPEVPRSAPGGLNKKSRVTGCTALLLRVDHRMLGCSYLTNMNNAGDADGNHQLEFGRALGSVHP